VETIQLFTTVLQCPDPTFTLVSDNYEVAKAWLDFMYSKISLSEINRVVTDWVAKQDATANMAPIVESLRQCALALKGT